MNHFSRRQSYAGDMLMVVLPIAMFAFLVNTQSTTTTSIPSSVAMATIQPTPSQSAGTTATSIPSSVAMATIQPTPSQSAGTTTTSIPSSVAMATIQPTPSQSAGMSSTVTPTQSPFYNTSFQITIEFVNISWKMELLNKTSPDYIVLEKVIKKAVENVFREINSTAVVQVIELKPGSVLAFLNVSTNKPEHKAKETLQNQMRNGMIGSLPVSKTLFSGSLFDVVLKIKAECNDSKELKGFKRSQNLTQAIQGVLPGNETATVQNVACLESENVTIVTVRVQIEDPTSENPNKELKDLKEKVDDGRLGNFTLIPEWQAYITGEKLFSVSFTLSSPSQDINKTIQELEEAIRDLFKNETDFRYITVELTNNKTAVVKVGMKTAASDQPNEALKPLKESVTNGKVGNTSVVKESFKAYINPNTRTQKVFEVYFRLNISYCDKSINSPNQERAKKAAVDYINQLKNYTRFINVKLQSLKCVDRYLNPKERFVEAVFLVYLTPDAPDKHDQFLKYLYFKKCNQILDWGVKFVTLTPTSSGTKVGYFTHWTCGTKSTTSPAASTGPTKEPTSSGIPPVEQNPRLYIKVKLGITWGEFCSKLEHSLKQKIAWNLYDKNGTRVSPDRIIFINVNKNCADPSKKDERADVWFYVSKSGSKKLHKCLTLKAYKVLKMFLENGNAKSLGPEFEGKVIHVDLAGEDASAHKTGFHSGKLSTLGIILIAIAGAVGLLLLTVACCCLFCCGANRRKKRKAGEESQKLHVVHVNANNNEGQLRNNKKENKQKEKSEGNDNDKENKDKNSTKEGKEKVISYENQAYGGLGKDDGEGKANKPGALAPVIVTSPAPDADKANDESNKNKGGQVSDTASSGSGGSRRGSASTRGEGQGRGSKQSSPVALRYIDTDRGRRRSSAHSIMDDEDVPLTHKTGTVGIVALALRNRNEKKKEAEFKNLSKDVPEEEVKYPANTESKNRSPDVLPAPKTRVKLSSNPDYINANWIRDHKGQRRYIATQHPLHETAEDFWRMVWEQESRLVVRVNEEEKEKPTEFMNYLPRGEGNTKNFGGIEVTIKQIVKKADYTITTLNATDGKKASSPREISHMHFTSWKERAVPNVALFVGFVTATREAKKKYGDTKAPTIVHCSDGLGFTGVYIAVDIGIKSHEESKTSVVDVFELSKNLRHDRHGIVCSLEQYNFIYQALYEYTVNYDESAEKQKL